MMENFESMKRQLSELATVLNAFKSESVQLRILDFVLGDQSAGDIFSPRGDDRTTGRAGTRRAPKKKRVNIKAIPDKGKKAPAGTGAVATLTQLLAGNFFDKPRTINDIIEHCKHNLARTFKANEFSGKLGRMVRERELTRKKNADKQYEYKKP
jgi:hypothetical protein